MAEVLVEVKTFKVTMGCDKCGIGDMRPTGSALMVYPPLYPHVCPNCNNQETYNATYPYIKHEEVKEPEPFDLDKICAAALSRLHYAIEANAAYSLKQYMTESQLINWADDERMSTDQFLAACSAMQEAGIPISNRYKYDFFFGVTGGAGSGGNPFSGEIPAYVNRHLIDWPEG